MIIIVFITCLLLPSKIWAEEPVVGGKATIVIDVETGLVLHEKNIYEELPMASTTKIMTALLAIENIPLDKMIKINPNAIGVEGSSIYLEANENIRAIDLVYGLMLRSGNDVATAIAYEVSGSVEEFSDLMNARAREIGANNTNFMNPHGLHHDLHYTTAYDLALITREALRNPTFKEVVQTKFWTAEREGYKHFANKNKTLNICEGGDGVKTGYTKKAGRCLVASATRDDMQFIAITLNDYSWFDTTKALLNYAFEQYSSYKVLEKGDIVKKILVEDGTKENVYLEVSKAIVLPIKENQEEKIISIIQVPEVIEAPVSKGEKIGKISTYLDGKLLGTADLLISEDIERLTTLDKIKRFFKF